MKKLSIFTLIIMSLLVCAMTACSCSCGSNKDKTSTSKSGNKTITYSFNINKTSMDLDVGASEQLNCTYGTETIVFESSDTAIATVDADGTVTGISEGEAYITAKAENVDGAEKICKVTVTKVEYSITLDRTGEINAIKGTSLEFTATVYKNGAVVSENATFSVNPSIKISQEKNVARITFDAVGSFEITAEFNGKKASVKVNVTESID